VESKPAQTSSRLHYVDWLKVLIVYGIGLFHISLVFSVGPWLVSNHERSMPLTLFVGFTFTWGIPAMFLIAGADAWLSLRTRKPSTFIHGRITRLLVPLLLGMALLTPLQRYLISGNPPPSISHLWSFYVSFFQSLRLSQAIEWVSLYGYHLWFLGYLFVISLASLPVLRWLKHHGTSTVDFLARASARRGGILIFAAPLCAAQMVLRPLFPDYQGWADVFTYTFVFLAGAVLVASPRFEAAIRRNIKVCLATGVVATVALGLLSLSQWPHVPPTLRFGTPVALGYSFFWGLNIWSWLVAVLYLGIRWLNVPNRVIDYAKESVMPFYVIHHPIVLGAAAFIVTWNADVAVKFLALVVVVYTLTLIVYEMGIRRWNPMRRLFGLKPLHRERNVRSHHRWLEPGSKPGAVTSRV